MAKIKNSLCISSLPVDRNHVGMPREQYAGLVRVSCRGKQVGLSAFHGANFTDPSSGGREWLNQEARSVTASDWQNSINFFAAAVACNPSRCATQTTLGFSFSEIGRLTMG